MLIKYKILFCKYKSTEDYIHLDGSEAPKLKTSQCSEAVSVSGPVAPDYFKT